MVNQRKMGAVLSYVNIIASLLVGLLYTPFMLRLLGQSEYGLYSLIGSVVGYLSILDLGLSNTIVRYTARNRVIGNDNSEAELNWLFLFVYLIIGIITAILGSILYANIENLFGNTLSMGEMERAKVMTLLLIFNLTFTFPLSVFGSIMQAYERFVWLRIINIVRVLLNPLIILPLLIVGYGSVMMVVVSTILNFICLLTNVYYCFHYLHIKFKRGKYQYLFLKEIMIYSFFIFLNVIMDKIYWGTGQFILGIVSGTLEVAIYSIAMQFMMMYMNFSTAISGVLLPGVTMMIANQTSSEELTNLMIKIGRLQYIIISYILLIFFLVGKEFLYLWAGKNYLSAYPIILLLMGALFIALVQNAGIAILQAMNLNKYRMTVYSIIAFVNVIVSIPLAKMYGGIGCAIATPLALVISTGLIMNRYYQKKIHINVKLFWKSIGSMTSSAILLLVISYLYQYFVVLTYSWMHFAIEFFVYSSIYFLLLFVLNMNSYEKKIFYTIFDRIKKRDVNEN
ncbi:teichoic acid transporter [Megasphaera cerevisiae DSM 20462]|uniref:Teichoic acid transporter n=1 Tax=Megasphaera cerevisiae DSM 20462 TaxID=1122219 RepID=A0A0J6WUU2_9FIRM|nr:oligosaccharide flippase family protein [Megasphaera cerevisiae]KMO85527.1 teichoic acid transporter [Megasphaera cerevisiae DSM 20462]SKA06642.1 Membrane protein involved in the export of O-antigen and teichoic acid [Megasphaera cerevisiae DSM 20462]